MSPVGRYTDPAEEQAAIARSRQSWDRILAARQQVTRADAHAVSTMAANYPHMSPGTVVPLARAGVAPDDPLAADVALREAKSNKKKKGFFGAVGDIVQGGFSGAMFLPELATGVGRNVISAGQALGDTAGRVVAGAASGAAVGAGVGFFAGGIGAIPGAIGGAVVGAGLGLAAEDVETEGFVNPLRQTTLGQDLLYGQSQGTGLLPGGTAAVAQADAARRSAAVSGHALTPGRYLATAVAEEGTAPYNLLSGAMDATVAWKLDPTDRGLKFASKIKADEARFLPSTRELKRRVAAGGGVDETVAAVRDPDRVAGARDVAARAQAKLDELDAEMDAIDTARAGGQQGVSGAGLERIKAIAKEKKAAEEARDRAAAVTGEVVERQGAGLVEGARKTIITEKVDAWLGTERGQKTLQWFADSDFETIRKGLGGDKVDVATVRDLADAKTLDEVDAILRPQLGIKGGVEVKPRVGGFGMEVKRKAAELPFFEKVAQSRLWSDLPSGRIAYDDPTDAVHQFDLLARDANIPAADLAGATRRFADALLEGTFEGKRRADMIVYETMGGAQGKVAQSEAGRAFMNKVHRRAGASDNDVLRALIDEDATKMASEHVTINGKTHNMPGASYLTDYMDMGIDIDRTTIRGIRATTSRYARVINNDKIQTGVTFTEHLTNDVWKPTALLRGAWTVRVVGEEQIRMAAAGRNSLFNHPISYLAWAMDDEGRIRNIFKNHGIDIGGRGAVDVQGERFAKEGHTIIPDADALDAELRDAAHGHFGEAVNHKVRAEAWAGDGFVEVGHKETYTRGAPGMTEAVAENIDNAAADPLMQMLATQPRHVVRQWFLEGDGNELRQALVSKHGAPLRSHAEVDKALDGAQRQLDSIMGRVSEVKTPVPVGGGMSADAAAQAQRAAQPGRPGSPAIRDAIATGKLNGVPIRDAKGRINKDFVAELNKLGDELPDRIVGSAARQDKKWAAKRDAGIQTLYTHLMTKPSAKLSRSPMFRQSYWEEARNLVTEMDPAAQQKLLASAGAAKLPKADMDALRLRAKAGSGEITLQEADMLAKGRALDQTQALLYDAAKRGQMSDVLRIIVPFAEAQKEVMQVWAKVGLVDNPAVLRRAQQTMTAARQTGTFYKDPTTGEEMFVFPGSQFLTEKTLGMPIPLTGRVAGLNMFGSGVIPGMGPAVQIPTRWLLPDKPQFDGIRKVIDPFGASASETEGILEQQFPGWLTAAKRAMSASDSDRTFSNAVKDVWAQGVSAGRYRTDTPEDIKEGLENAKRGARWLYTIKAFASIGGAPTPPSPSFQAMDKDGKWHMAKALSEDYRKMADDPEIGFEGASAAFLEKYGNNAFAFMQAKTYSTVPSAPSTADFRTWTGTAEGSKVMGKYGDVAALFGPQGEGFDYGQYLRNLKSGDTVNLTPEQFTEQTNNRLASMIYYNERDKFGPAPSKEQRAWLSDLKDQLREKFPGYGVELPGKPDANTVKNQYIPAIVKAVEDPALAGNDVARAAKLYLQARDAALESVEGAGYASFESSKAAAPIRDWLRQVLQQLTERVPDFAPMAERVFEREMINDEEVVQTATATA